MTVEKVLLKRDEVVVDGRIQSKAHSGDGWTRGTSLDRWTWAGAGVCGGKTKSRRGSTTIPMSRQRENPRA